MTMGAILHINHGTSERAKEKRATLGRFPPCRSTGRKDEAGWSEGGGAERWANLPSCLSLFCRSHSPSRSSLPGLLPRPPLFPPLLVSLRLPLFLPDKSFLTLACLHLQSHPPLPALAHRPIEARETELSRRVRERSKEAKKRTKNTTGTRHVSVASQPPILVRGHDHTHSQTERDREAKPNKQPRPSPLSSFRQCCLSSISISPSRPPFYLTFPSPLPPPINDPHFHDTQTDKQAG